MGCALLASIGQVVLVLFSVVVVVINSTTDQQQPVSHSRPRCEFEVEIRTSEKSLRCYSLPSLTPLERFIGDGRPVKVQVLNGPLETFHLNSAVRSGDDGNDGGAADKDYAINDQPPSRDFYGRIRELDLSSAGQVVIQEDRPAFERMQGLRSLILSQSNLSRILPVWFDGMDNNQIEFVDVSRNGIRDLILNQEDLPKLQTLNVSHNAVQRVSLTQFEHLESLVLNSNQLVELNFLQQFRNLKNLHVEMNDLREVRAVDFQNHLDLEHLSMSSNYISHIEPTTFDRLGLLRHLNLSHNLLAEMQFFTILTRLSSLEVLDLSYNKIQELPSLQLFKMDNLEYFNLSHNFLTELPEKSLSGLFSLRRLDLQWNRLQAIHPNSLNQLFELEFLDVSGNNLQYLDSNLFTFAGRKLKRLFLQNNQLASVDEQLFSNTRKLIQLNLAGNKLKELPDQIFHQMPNLRVLHLEHNQLESFSLRHLQQSHQLRVLFLHHNHLTYIEAFDRAHLGRLRKVTILTIDNNPWQCACMDEMLALLAKAKVNYSYEAGYFENATLKIMCVVTEKCFSNLIDRHENYIRELFFGKF